MFKLRCLAFRGGKVIFERLRNIKFFLLALAMSFYLNISLVRADVEFDGAFGIIGEFLSTLFGTVADLIGNQMSRGIIGLIFMILLLRGIIIAALELAPPFKDNKKLVNIIALSIAILGSLGIYVMIEANGGLDQALKSFGIFAFFVIIFTLAVGSYNLLTALFKETGRLFRVGAALVITGLIALTFFSNVLDKDPLTWTLVLLFVGLIFLVIGFFTGRKITSGNGSKILDGIRDLGAGSAEMVRRKKKTPDEKMNNIRRSYETVLNSIKVMWSSISKIEARIQAEAKDFHIIKGSVDHTNDILDFSNKTHDFYVRERLDENDNFIKELSPLIQIIGSDGDGSHKNLLNLIHNFLNIISKDLKLERNDRKYDRRINRDLKDVKAQLESDYKTIKSDQFKLKDLEAYDVDITDMNSKLENIQKIITTSIDMISQMIELLSAIEYSQNALAKKSKEKIKNFEGMRTVCNHMAHEFREISKNLQQNKEVTSGYRNPSVRNKKVKNVFHDFSEDLRKIVADEEEYLKEIWKNLNLFKDLLRRESVNVNELVNFVEELGPSFDGMFKQIDNHSKHYLEVFKERLNDDRNKFNDTHNKAEVSVNKISIDILNKLSSDNMDQATADEIFKIIKYVDQIKNYHTYFESFAKRVEDNSGYFEESDKDALLNEIKVLIKISEDTYNSFEHKAEVKRMRELLSKKAKSDYKAERPITEQDASNIASASKFTYKSDLSIDKVQNSDARTKARALVLDLEKLVKVITNENANLNINTDVKAKINVDFNKIVEINNSLSTIIADNPDVKRANDLIAIIQPKIK